MCVCVCTLDGLMQSTNSEYGSEYGFCHLCKWTSEKVQNKKLRQIMTFKYKATKILLKIRLTFSQQHLFTDATRHCFAVACNFIKNCSMIQVKLIMYYERDL